MNVNVLKNVYIVTGFVTYLETKQKYTFLINGMISITIGCILYPGLVFGFQVK